MSGAQMMKYAQDPNGYPIDLGRPIVQIAPGEYGTEYSQTAKLGDRYYNYPTIYGGQVLNPEDAYSMFRQGLWSGGWPYPNFSSEEEAIKAAKKRSKEIGRLRDMK